MRPKVASGYGELLTIVGAKSLSLSFPRMRCC